MKMVKKRTIKIELSEEEEALVYYERICGRNESIKKHAKVLYYANRGTTSLREWKKKSQSAWLYGCSNFKN